MTTSPLPSNAGMLALFLPAIILFSAGAGKRGGAPASTPSEKTTEKTEKDDKAPAAESTKETKKAD